MMFQRCFLRGFSFLFLVFVFSMALWEELQKHLRGQKLMGL